LPEQNLVDEGPAHWKYYAFLEEIVRFLQHTGEQQQRADSKEYAARAGLLEVRCQVYERNRYDERSYARPGLLMRWSQESRETRRVFTISSDTTTKTWQQLRLMLGHSILVVANESLRVVEHTPYFCHPVTRASVGSWSGYSPENYAVVQQVYDELFRQPRTLKPAA
jgi:hypothetical protein